MMQPMSPQVANWERAQKKNSSTRAAAAGQVREAQVATQEMLPVGGREPRSRQPRVQPSTSPQLTSVHSPQSASQLTHVSLRPSPVSQRPLPQTEQAPQSRVQEAQSSVRGSQVRSPQPSHTPQSRGQVKQLSVAPSQRVSPQPGQRPQSGVHEEQSSPASG